jgi:hypothetical protein
VCHVCIIVFTVGHGKQFGICSLAFDALVLGDDLCATCVSLCLRWSMGSSLAYVPWLLMP